MDRLVLTRNQAVRPSATFRAHLTTGCPVEMYPRAKVVQDPIDVDGEWAFYLRRPTFREEISGEPLSIWIIARFAHVWLFPGQISLGVDRLTKAHKSKLQLRPKLDLA